ncbi:MAG TPA: hypothetical protein VG757_06085 [Devosia sp.]|nr:hypothetical protein [Devosia sp.]
MASRDAVMVLVHFWSPELERHVARIRRESEGLCDVYVAFNLDRRTELPPGLKPEIVVTLEKCAAVQPRRYAEWKARNMESIYHFTDLVMMAALTDPVLAPYEYIWFVEYDVDYSGNWGDFFRRARDYSGDLLCTHLRTRTEYPNFDHWFWYAQPDWVTVDAVRGFFPISRFSHRALRTIVTEMEKPGWKGHFELVYPTIAAACGLTISDLGDRGSFTPPERENQNYSRAERTHRFRPPRVYRYYGDDPRPYRYRDRIHHPVKAEWTRGQRIKEELRSIWHRANIHLPPFIWVRKVLGLGPVRPKIGQ